MTRLAPVSCLGGRSSARAQMDGWTVEQKKNLARAGTGRGARLLGPVVCSKAAFRQTRLHWPSRRKSALSWHGCGCACLCSRTGEHGACRQQGIATTFGRQTTGVMPAAAHVHVLLVDLTCSRLLAWLGLAPIVLAFLGLLACLARLVGWLSGWLACLQACFCFV